jgi:hypothetical protein
MRLSLLGKWHAVDRSHEERCNASGAETIHDRLTAGSIPAGQPCPGGHCGNHDLLIGIADYDGIADRWMLTKRLFNFCRRDQSTVDFLSIRRSTQNMQEPVPVQAAKIAGIIPSILVASC